MTNGEVTVVIPTRDRPRFLLDAVRSIRAQVGGSPQIVIVDDGSIEPIGPVDGISPLRNDTPQGAAAARNRGLAQVRTRWVAFCDDDDLWAPTKLATQFAGLAAHPGAAWSYTGTVEVDSDFIVRGAQRALDSGWIEMSLLGGNVVSSGSTVLTRTEILRTVGGFAEELRAAEDWELWTRLARVATVAAVDQPLVAWRRHQGNKSSQWSAKSIARLEARLRIRANELGTPLGRGYVAQAAIDQAVAERKRGAVARAYWSRFRMGKAPRDAVVACAGLVAPRMVAYLKQREHRLSVPPEWEAELGWLADLAPAPGL